MEHENQTQKLTLKHFGLLCIIMICTAFPSPAKAEPIEKWHCTLDLHQGDTGTLEFNRTGTLINGRTRVHRGANTFENKVKGNWSGATIEFWRELNPSSSGQPFRGIAVTADDSKVKMAGRFANQFAGIWSGDCERKAGLRPARTLRVPNR
jgi:hypothetical protein